MKSQYGHTPLSEKELEFLSKEEFDALYISTGYQNSMPITPKAQDILEKYKATILCTPEAVKKIEQEKRPFVAIIHITC